MVWFVIMIPTSLLFTGIGIYAMRREKPMWFWSGSSVAEKDISDVKAYNRANGIMWIVFSGIFWISTLLGLYKTNIAGAVLIVGCIVGGVVLPIAYRTIYERYRVR